MTKQFTSADDVRSFTMAGNATLTLESARTRAHFTYRVKQAKDRDGKPTSRWFVGLLTGPNNDADYTYLGVLETKYEAPCPAFRLTAKSRVGEDAPSVKAFRYMWKHVCSGDLPAELIVRHDGNCGRCGRTLTVPESIDRGIGPECWSKMGGADLSAGSDRLANDLADVIKGRYRRAA